MYELIYTSVARKPMKQVELEDLLAQSRSRNLVYGITGLLVYDYGAFLQVLEGQKHEVETVFASIERDARHTSVKVLPRSLKPEREFASWTMAWVDISNVSRRDPHLEYDLPRLNLKQARSYLRRFLKSASL